MGDRLGRYVVLRHLASGGMADVLLARTDGIEGFVRHVVLKRIKPEHARDQRFMSMFLDEARLAANLHHGNIVQVFDIGESNGEYFFAMEYLHGEDLRAILSAVAKQRSHVPLGHVVGIVAAAAAGLHHAHERRGPDRKSLGIVHRDVSPSNILIGYDGTPKLVDFGIAKAAARTNETHSGTLKGKVAYMSPEQCKSEPVDRRSDVYALGVVLYELATTTRLFKGDNDYLMMDAICNGKVPLPRVRRAELPNELSMIIMKALSLDPARRYQTADELRVALEQFGLAFGLSTSTSGLADYMHKLFGEKPEPWLDDATVDEAPLARRPPTKPAAVATVASRPAELVRAARSTSEVDAVVDGTSADPRADLEPKTITNGSLAGLQRVATAAPSFVRITAPAPVVAAVTLSQPAVAPPPPVDPTRTSTKMAWEPSPASLAPVRNWSSGKLAAALLVAIALVGVASWKLLSQPATATATISPALTATEITVPAAAAAPASEPPHDVTVVHPAAVTATVAGKKPVAVAVAPKPPGLAPRAVARQTVALQAAAPPAVASQAVAPQAVAPPAVAPQAVAVAVAVPVAAPNPVPAPLPVPAPVPGPPMVEIVLAHLSDATVQAVARDHGAELSRCEADGVHGEVTVHFQIDAAGRVTKKQLSSTLGKPKVAGCILASLGHWQFPKPPSGGADGTYTLSFQ